jgi:hypothetical protein
LLITAILFVVPGISLAAEGNQQTDTEAAGVSAGYYDKGPVFLATLVALEEEGPVKDDLTARGLFTYLAADDLEVIDIGGITKLVEAGVYSIDGTSKLRIGPQIEGQKAAATAKSSATYKYAQMVTRRWEIFDEFKYRGHRCYVDIPANLELESGTIHNVYSTHMGSSDCYYFLECGVGWWSSNRPYIYTYDTYSCLMYRTRISSGVSRDIYMKITIDSEDYEAKMYVRDPYDDKYVRTYQEVYTLNHRVDQCQEQASYTDTWSETSKVKAFSNRLINKYDDWVDWDDDIATDWDHNSPLRESHGITNNMKWIKTWCNP